MPDSEPEFYISEPETRELIMDGGPGVALPPWAPKPF